MSALSRVSDIRPRLFCTVPRPTAPGKLHRGGDACSTGGKGPEATMSSTKVGAVVIACGVNASSLFAI